MKNFDHSSLLVVEAPSVVNLSDQQQAVASSTASHLIVSALAGSGKTTAVASLVANAVSRFSDPVLVLAYTNVAKEQIAAALSRSGVPASSYEVLTVDALAYRVVRNALGVETLKVSDGVSEMKEALRLCGFRLSSAAVGSALSWVSHLLADSPDRFSYLAAGLPRSEMPRVMRVFSALCARRGVWTWDQLRYAALAEDASYGYSAVVVDEAQDLAPAQYALVEAVSSSASQTVLVGDANQSIFGYAGVDPALLTKLSSLSGWSVLPLTQTFRCSRAVASFVASLGSVEGLSDVSDYQTASNASGSVSVVSGLGDIHSQAAWLSERVSEGSVVLGRTKDELS